MAAWSTSWASPARGRATAPFVGRSTRHCTGCGSFWSSRCWRVDEGPLTKVSGVAPPKRLQMRREKRNERVLVSLPRRGGRSHSGETAADDAEVDDLAEGSGGERPHQGPGTAARAAREAGHRQTEDGDGRTVRGGQGCRGRLYADRGSRLGASRGAVEGLSHLRARWG